MKGGMLKVTHIYTGDDSRSHSRDVEVRLSLKELTATSVGFSATAIKFRHRLPQYSGLLVNAPCRQFVVILDGCVELELADGMVRTFNAGDVGFIEDIVGEGHISRIVQETMQLDIPVEGEFQIELLFA